MGLASEHLEVNMVSLVTLLPQSGGAKSTYRTEVFFIDWDFLSVYKWNCFSV